MSRLKWICSICGDMYAYKCKCARCGVATDEIKPEPWPEIQPPQPVTRRVELPEGRRVEG